MGTAALNPEGLRDMLLHVSARMVESRDVLTQADKAIGDGDHGVGMARGFEAVALKLAAPKPAAQPFGTPAEVLEATGMTLLTSVGGAAGAVFGTLFRGGAKGLKGRGSFDAPALALWLRDGLQAVQERGKAKPGDKTLLDALEPAALAAQAQELLGLDQALAAAASAARDGMERTKEFVATVGKAKTLGERSLGHADPGAISLTLILEAMAEYAREH